jgi:hypothetical protein
MVIAASGLSRRKGPMGQWQVQIDGRWVPEEEADVKITGPIAPPANPPSEVKRWFVTPERVEAPPAPAPAPPEPPEPAGPKPSERQRRAWELCAPPPEGQGLYWSDAAPILGVDVSNTSRLVRRYMEVMGIPGEAPGRLPDDERVRRQTAARKAGHQAATTSAPTAVAAADGAAQDAHAGASDPDAHAGASDPDEGAAAQPSAGTSPEPEPSPETRPSGEGDGLLRFPVSAVPVAITDEASGPTPFTVLSAELARARDEQTEATARAAILGEIVEHLEAALDGFVRLSMVARP